MSGLKSGGLLLLLLAMPFAAYIVWQVNGVTRTDLIASEPPPERGATKEQLAAVSAKASAWSGETRKAVTVAWQYRAASPEEATKDEAVSGVIKAAAARAADLNDLDKFLSDVERPVFLGKLKARFEKWQEDQTALRDDEQAVKEWLGRARGVASAAEADKAMNEVAGLIDQYGRRSRFADRAKAAQWRLRARLQVIDALANTAGTQYTSAMEAKLPLREKDSAALTTIRGLKTQITALTNDLRQADDDKLAIDNAIRASVEAKGAVADEWAAREELLSLFAKDDLFRNATGAAAWLKQVATQYRKTKDEKVRALIREKVQEFCDVFIPPAVRLDEKVELNGKEVPRKDIVIEYEEKAGAKPIKERLSDDASKFTEFTLQGKPPGVNHIVRYDAKEYDLSALKPTELSRAAVLYNEARKTLADGTTGPKWSAKSVEELKKKCDAKSSLVDQLQILDGGPGAARIHARLTGLDTGIKASPELFD